MVLIMNRKKVFLLLVSLAFMSLFAGVVFATHTSTHDSFLPEVIEDAARFLFVDLGTFIDTAPDTFVIYSKFLFFILVFSIFYWGISKAMKDNMRIGGTIAFIFAIIGTVMLPKSYMIFLFQTYSQVIGFAFGILPFVIGLIISFTVFKGDETWQRILRGIVLILMGVFTGALVQTLRGFENTLYVELAQWAEIGAFISMIIGVVILIGGIGGGGGTGAGGWLGNGARNAWNSLTGGGKDNLSIDAEARDRDRRYEEDVREAERLNERLRELRRKLQEELSQLRGDELEQLRLLANLIKELGEIQEQLNTARRLR